LRSYILLVRCPVPAPGGIPVKKVPTVETSGKPEAVHMADFSLVIADVPNARTDGYVAKYTN
jgi:hypothetical protein